MVYIINLLPHSYIFTMRSFLVFILSFVAVFSGAFSASSLTNSDQLDNLSGEKKNVITDLIINGILDIYAPVSGDFDNDLCRNHGTFYKESVKKGQLWALKMLDSSSKFPEGILMGNTIQLGNFDECVGVENVPSDFGAFSGKHCLASLSSNSAAGGGLAFQWSICVPSSCRPQDVQQHLHTALPGNFLVNVLDTSCYSKATAYPFSAADWFAVGFLSFFGLLVVLSTSYDLVKLNSDSRQPVLAAFSVYTNGAKLLSSPTSSPDNLACVHGVRFLSMAWVVLGHRYYLMSLSPAINRSTVIDYLQDWKHMIITNATISVDSFLLLSGTLVCYIFMKEMEKRTSFNVFLYYIHRYIRLTPPYAVVILLSATLFSYLGDGPFWQIAGSPGRSWCQRSWWINLLYLNNYVRPDVQCLGTSWYMAIDMQLFWLSPLVLLPLLKWPKVGKPLLGGLIGVGLLTAFLVSFLNEFPASFISTEAATEKQYYPTHTRFTPWLIGIGLGYILHTTKNTTLRMSNAMVALGWVLSFGLLLASWLLAHRFNQFDHQYERAFESIYTCLMRPAWALGLAWVIFACIKGYGGFINTFLSWNVFQILGRLTYTAYLLHFAILIGIYASLREPVYISDSAILMQYFADMVIIFAAACVLSLVFESPAIIIERHFLGGLTKKVKKNDDENILQQTSRRSTQKDT